MKHSFFIYKMNSRRQLLKFVQSQLLVVIMGFTLLACSSSESTTVDDPAATEAAEAPELADQDITGANVMLEAHTEEPYGAYLTDASGRTLYIFMADTAQASTCYGPCADAWPPLITEEGNPKAGPEVSEAMVGTVERQDGRMQVTYNGWPLYYYVKDQAAGQFTGQDIMDFGAEWYMITPSGEKVHAEGH